MIWKIASIVCLAACALGDRPAISEQQITIKHGKHHGDLSHIGPHKPEHHEEYAWAYPSYEFSYKVDDPHTHDQKGQHETRDGDVVKGEYWLIEPDGRKRTVKYHADKHSGFNAQVEYSAPLHHVQHKHVEHKPVIEHRHVEHKPVIEHRHVEHKPVIEHRHVEHKPVIEYHHVEHKPVVEHRHKPLLHHIPWVSQGHHDPPHHRPMPRKMEENYLHPRFYRTPRE